MEIWIKNLIGQGEATMLALEVAIVVLAVVVFNFVLRRVLARMEEKTRQTADSWNFALVSAIRRPLTVLAWVEGIAFACQVVQGSVNSVLFEAVSPARTVGVIACLAWFLMKFINNAQRAVVSHRLARGEPVDRTTVDALGKLLRISVQIVAVLVGLQSLGFSIAGVLAFGGIGGIAIGFAAKDLLANFFGGLTVYLDRPFAVGDWIRSPDKQIEGTVETIGWRLTRIRTFDKRPLYVPNQVFTQISVENPSRMSHRRINETIGLRYDDIAVLPAVVEDIRTMLAQHPEIDPAQTLIVNLNQLGEYSLDLMIYTFTRTTEWVKYQVVKQDVLLQIAAIIERHGAQIAFPTRISYSAPLPGGVSVAPASAKSEGGETGR
ncbi:mechanosensitive ion channel protein MscS [Betaproteobacteria bacterium]|nr:mechanosensitive ion channel protein MscS [Betaproteobacteria bacterium]GHT97279.1 mechanosensitive ion channel protein MscS [Betaproteobacteria bacterium]GHU20785.1 mechanosensitive ion channel protein MscS [Betaproteobacteria bacterium]